MASSGKDDEEKTKPEGQRDGRTGDKMIDDAVDKMLPIFLEDGVIDHTDPINDSYFKEIVDVAGPMLVPGLGQPDPEVSTVFGCYNYYDNFMNLTIHSSSIYSSIGLSIHLLINPLTYPFTHPSIYQSIPSFIRFFINPSFHPPI